MISELPRPSEHRNISTLLATPYQDLATIFTDLTENEYGQELGGFARQGVVCKLPTSKEVQMSFTNEQRPYVGLCINAVGRIVDGSVMGTQIAIPTLDQRIVAKHQSNTDASYRFIDAVRDGFLDSLTAFQKHHPNLMPALHGMFEVAGAEGTEIALLKCNNALAHCYEGKLTHENRQEYVQALLPDRNSFIGAHVPYTDDAIDPYEVWCTGSSLTPKLINRSVKAALFLADQNDEIPISSRATSRYVVKDENMSKHLKEHVRRLAQEIANLNTHTP